MFFTIYHLRLIIYFLITVTLSAGCAERENIESAKAVTYVDAVIENVTGALSERNVISSALEPELIQSQLIPTTETSLLVGPHLSESFINTDTVGNVMLGWNAHSITTPGEFAPKFLYRDTGANIWQESLPMPVVLQNDVDELSLAMDRRSGVIVASWVDLCSPNCSNVFSNRFEPGVGWQTETLHGTGRQIKMLIDSQANATVFWDSLPSLNNPLTFNGQFYDSITGWGNIQTLNTLITPIPPDPVIPPPTTPPPIVDPPVVDPPVVDPPVVDPPIADPVVPPAEPSPPPIVVNNLSKAFFNADIDAQGNSLLVWNFGNDSVSPDAFKYGSAEFSPINGWQNKRLSQFGYASTQGDAEILVAATTEAGKFNVIVDAESKIVFGNTKTMIQSAIYANGLWQESLNLVPVDTTSYSATLPYIAKSNLLGDIVLAWVEVVDQESALFGNVHIHGKGWAGAKKIYGPIIQPSVPDQTVIPVNKILDNLVVDINDNGSAVVSWVDNVSNEKRFLLSQYDGLSDWKQVALITQINGLNEYINSTSIAIGNDNRIYALWNQVELLVDNWDSKLFLAEDDYFAFPIAPLSKGVKTNTPPIPLQADSWSNAAKLWRKNAGINTDAHTSDLRVNFGDLAMITFEYKADYSEQNNDYKIHEVLLISKDPQTSQWRREPLSISAIPNNAIKSAFNNNTKNSYAVFRSGNTVYINRKRQFLNWSEERAVYSGPNEDYDVFALFNAGAIVTTSPAQEKNSIVFREVKYVAGVPQLSIASEQSIADAVIISDSVVNNFDQILTLWLKSEEITPGVFNESLQLSKFDTVNLWDISAPALAVDTINTDQPIILTINAQNEALLIAVDNTNAVVSNVLTDAAGWGNWVNIDNNINSGDLIMSSPYISRNFNNDLMLVWTEEELSVTGVAHVIYTSSLSAAAGSWAAPERVAATKHPGPQQFVKIKLADDGNAIAYWPLSLSDRSAIMVNKYINGVGWNVDPEEVRSYQYTDLPLLIISNMDATIIRNEITVSWMERNLYNDGEMSLWSASSAF